MGDNFSMDSYENFFVGAYTSSPTLFKWDYQQEQSFFTLLKSSVKIKGLELPYYGQLHLHDEEKFLRLLDENWRYVITAIPGNMEKISNNINFGLASNDSKGSLEAICFYSNIAKVIEKINSHFGGNRVDFVSIATSPSIKKSLASSSADSLYNSLKILLDLNWNGAKLMIEHCDSGKNEWAIKGFLSLEDEIDVVCKLRQEGYNVGITLNWGRSAIEYKDKNGILKHLDQIIENNLDYALMFSGVSNETKSAYGIWQDLHAPIASANGIMYGEKYSLMDYDSIYTVFEKVKNYKKADFIGIKLMPMPFENANMQTRVGINRDTLKVISSIYVL
ncbi:DUF4862 family protein [Campylobacter lari]|nr:DUF4862 family protein [Campylobacter lari]